LKLLLDTHLLIWAAAGSERLPVQVREMLGEEQNEPLFSAASIWEIAIKASMGRADFKVEPRLLRRGLLEGGWKELAIASDHALAAGDLPPIHKDPFDRLLVAQALVEGVVLLTADPVVARYPAPIRKVEKR